MIQREYFVHFTHRSDLDSAASLYTTTDVDAQQEVAEVVFNKHTTAVQPLHLLC